MTRQEVFELIEKERQYQNKKWQRKDGEWNRPNTLKLTVLAEEFGEVARAILEENFSNLKKIFPILKKNLFRWLL